MSVNFLTYESSLEMMVISKCVFYYKQKYYIQKIKLEVLKTSH